jgi:hypothetical protein
MSMVTDGESVICRALDESGIAEVMRHSSCLLVWSAEAQYPSAN